MHVELDRVIDPVISGMGYEYVGCEYVRDGRLCLRVYIDKQPDGVTLDDCAKVSRELSTVLDVEDSVSGSYNLEVSSPGIERPLFKKSHYEKVIGQLILIHLKYPLNNRRKYKGILKSIQDDNISLSLDDGSVAELVLGNVKKAHVVMTD